MQDWNAIRAEYIGGGISQRKLAKKHGVSETTLMKRANVEGWNALRKEAESKSTAAAQQKTANIAADNAMTAERIKARILARLERIEQKYPYDATEVRAQKGKNTVIYRIRDLTAALKDLTGDMPKRTSENDDPVSELLRRWDDASGQ